MICIKCSLCSFSVLRSTGFVIDYKVVDRIANSLDAVGFVLNAAIFGEHFPHSINRTMTTIAVVILLAGMGFPLGLLYTRSQVAATSK